MAVKGSYETVMVFSVKGGEEKAQELKEKFKAMIEEQAEEVSMDDWGKRKLAYEIDDLTEGHYILMHFESESSLPKELERNFKISEDVMRFLVIRKEA